MSELSEQRFLIDPNNQSLLVRPGARMRAGRANAEAHKAGLAKQATLIPSCAVFRQLCMKDLTEAFHEDRQSAARAQKNRRRVQDRVSKIEDRGLEVSVFGLS